MAKVRYARKRKFGTKKKSAKVSKSVKKYVKRVVDNEVETKIIESTFTMKANTYSPTASNVILNTMAQGLTIATRVGEKVKNKYLQIRLRVTGDSGAADPLTDNSVYRLYIIKDKIPNALRISAMTAATDSPFFGAANALFPETFHNYANDARYEFLHDKCYVVNSSRATTKWTKFHTFNIPLTGHTQYSGPGATVASMYKDVYYFGCASSNNGSAIQGPDVGGYYRFHFQDA